ncbi:integrin alpha-4-like isoform X3 [Apostichopus japonicus]|uniref:integrin alpha-4-like isoform X3 n=1 Tax=Stichopus japonicus TaxID=307972 RepID=UPI003AB3A642
MIMCNPDTLVSNVLTEKSSPFIKVISKSRLPRMTSPQILIAMFVSIFGICHACNLDITEPTRYRGEDGEYFGYTVLQYKDFLSSTYLLVGAPRGNSTHQLTLTRPGKVYKCTSSSTCDQINLDNTGNENSPGRIDVKNNQWLGVSLSAEDKEDGLISACGHRYANNHFMESETGFTRNDSYPIGVCYKFKIKDYQDDVFGKKFPCLDASDQWRGDTRWLSWCQAGLGTAFTNIDETALYGAPGAFNGTGTVVVDNHTSFSYPEPSLFTDNSEYETEYNGYAVASGHFVGLNDTVQGVAGAPRAKETGKVTIYDISNKTKYQEIFGEKRYTYFGSAIASVDLDQDGLTDLLIGAPFYSNNQDEGKVYVYHNTGSQTNPLKLVQEIQGMQAVGARFGSAISGCGDINNDSFIDVVIGAPYEDDGAGAIYIYLGAKDGVDPHFSQRVSGASLDPPVKTLGISVHGGVDMDGNLYPDVAVGAYENDTAYLFKAKPIVDITAWLEINPQSLDPGEKGCDLRGEMHACVELTACFKFSGVSATFGLDIEYSIEVDTENTKAGIDSRFFLTDEKMILINKTIKVQSENVRQCDGIVVAYLSNKARDFLTPVLMKLTYDVFKYEVQTSVRGDEPYLFAGGLPPVIHSHNCGAQNVTEKVRFTQNCGSDAICKTDIEVSLEAELPGYKDDELILGASRSVHFNAKIDNNGEDAHQAVLNVYHPTDVKFERVEVEAVTCLPLADQRGVPCTAEVAVTCLPSMDRSGDSGLLECSLGNPMNANNSATLRLQFDVSNISWSQEREINITMVVYTESMEAEEEKANNMKQLIIRVIVMADVGVIGKSQPESIYYGYNATTTGESNQEAADKLRLDQAMKAVSLFYEHNGDETRFNQSHIGPGFNHEFQMEPSNKGVCNKPRILELQRNRENEAYVTQDLSKIPYAEDKKSSQQPATADDSRQFGCDIAECVDLLCKIFPPFERDDLVKITVDMLLWEHTLVTGKFDFVELVSTGGGKSDDPANIHNQPEGHEADSVQISTLAYTGTMGTMPTKWWVILLAIILGMLFLMAAVGLLWKIGFFKRSLKDEMGVKCESTAVTSESTEEQKNTDPPKLSEGHSNSALEVN